MKARKVTSRNELLKKFTTLLDVRPKVEEDELEEFMFVKKQIRKVKNDTKFKRVEMSRASYDLLLQELLPKQLSLMNAD